jgi:hypothetical protein
VLAAIGCGPKGARPPGSSATAADTGDLLSEDAPPGEAGKRLFEAVELIDAGQLDAAEKILLELRNSIPTTQ